MPVEWAVVGRIAGWLGLKGRKRVRKWAGDRQQLLTETAETVTAVKEFIRHANPMAASAGRDQIDGFELQWNLVRADMVTAVDRHPSDVIQKLGNELPREVEKLLMGLRYLANPHTDPDVKAAAYESVDDLHVHALKLANELLKKVRDY